MQNFFGFFLLLLTVSGSVAHSQAIEVTQDMQGIAVGTSLRFLEDAKREMTSDAVLALDPSAFKPNAQQNLNFGFSRSAWWARFEMNNPGSQPLRVFVEHAYANADSIDFYAWGENGARIAKHTGDQVPFRERDVAYRFPVFIVDVPPGIHSYFIRIETEGVVQFPIRLWNAEAFHTKRSSESAFMGTIYGFFLVMIFYNLLLGLSTRSGISLLYVGFILAAIGNFFGYQGLWLVFMPDEVSSWFANYGFIMSTGFFAFFGTAFTYAFLNLRDHHRLIRYLTYATGGIGLLVVALSPFSYNVVAKISIINAFFTAFALLAASIAACLRHFRPAYFFTFAWLLSIAGNLANPLAVAGLIPVNMFTLWSPFLGVAVELVLISLALGDKMRLQQELAEQQIRELNTDLERKVEEKTRDIKAIMKNIKLGIFAIQKNNFSIHRDYSQHLDEMFGQTHLQDRPVLPLLFQNSSLTGDEKQQVQSALEASIGEDAIAFELNEPCLPREIRYEQKAAEKIFEFDWSPMLNGQGQVERLLVTAKDVTDIRRYRMEAENRQKELNYIAELINVSQDKFGKFSASAHHFIEENHRLLAASDHSRDTLKILFINMHTLKGAARSLGFKELATIIHTAENTLAALQKGDQAWNREQLRKELEMVEHSLAHYDWISTNRLNRSLHTLDSIEVRIEDLEKEVHAIEELQANPNPQQTSFYLLQMKQRMARYAFRPAVDIFRELCEPAPKLAKDLDKLPPKITIEGEGVVFTHRAVELLRNVFVHILRNALDHGIESAAERTAAQKDPHGQIEITMHAETDRQLCISIRDDGRGLALGMIRQIATIKGFIGPHTVLAPEALAQFIFESGFSTSSSLSEISGRGVGMDAVRRWLEKEGANVSIAFDTKVEINRHSFASFHLNIRLPQNLYRQIETIKVAAA